MKSFCRGVQGGQFFQKAPPLAAGGIHVENRLVEIEVPEDFLGKDVEITIKEKEVKTNTTELEDFFSRFNYDLSDLVFNRDELHER